MGAIAEPLRRRTTRTMADVLRRLGNVHPSRVLWNPTPGTATIADLERLIDKSVKGVELVDGTLVRKAMGWKESAWASFLIEKMNPYTRATNLGFLTGEAGLYRLGDTRVRSPDVAFVPWSILPAGESLESPFVPGAPLFAVEVLSRTNTRGEMALKRRHYFASGLKLLWEADPRKRTVRVYTTPTDFTDLTASDSLDGGTLLPGFSLPVAEWFAELDRLNRLGGSKSV